MKKVLENFAEEYTLMVTDKLSEVHGKRKAYNPILFLLVGDKSGDALKEIKRNIDERWSNSHGIAYLHLSSERKNEESWLNGVEVKYDSKDKKILRQNLYKSFLQQDKQLADINDEINKLKNKIQESGPLFPYFDKLSICVVTCAEDPLNALTIPMTLLIKEKFNNIFKVIYTDLFELIQERSTGEDDSFNHAVSMSFFKEIEYCQKGTFKFEELINVQKSGAKFKVINSSYPVFNVIYLLSDRNRKGFLLQDAMKKNSQIIAYIALLKHSNDSSDIGNYDDNHFTGNMGYGEKQLYASAGLSKVKRPNEAIAYTVVYACYESLLNSLKEMSFKTSSDILGIFGIDEKSMDLRLEKLLPSENRLDMMTGIMTSSSGDSSSYLRKMNLRSFESHLYGNSASRFFNKNIKEVVEKSFNTIDFQELFRQHIYEALIPNPGYGLFGVFQCTEEDGLTAALKEMIKRLDNAIKTTEDRINANYNKRVKLSFLYIFPWMRAKVLYKVKLYLFQEIYRLKLHLLKLQLKKSLCSIYEKCIKNIHDELCNHISATEEILKELKLCCENELQFADEYLGGNIKGHYTSEVAVCVETMGNAARERFISLFKNMKDGKEAFCRELTNFCRDNLFNDQRFFSPFEEEMHNRANASITQDDDTVIAWEELYKKIYTTLESNAEVNINILDFTLNNVYEEKYFFGNYTSKFIQYAFNYDSSSRNYKLGCVNERNSKGIEKLRLLGGFYLDNLTFYNECAANYDYYLRDGYKLHGILQEGEVNNNDGIQG